MNTQWPVKILLVHPRAEFLRRDKISIVADCAILVNTSLSEKYGKETVVIGCPLLEDPNRILSKITLMVKEVPDTSSFEVYTMEVPCCHALHMMVMRALKESGREKHLKASYHIVRVASGRIEAYRPGFIDESMVEAERRAHGHP